MNDREKSCDGRRSKIRCSQFVSVSAVRPFDGVGRALASAYPAVDQSAIPADMALLLDKLDRSYLQRH